MENASSISKPPISFAAQPVVAPKALFIGVLSACHGAGAPSINLDPQLMGNGRFLTCSRANARRRLFQKTERPTCVSESRRSHPWPPPRARRLLRRRLAARAQHNTGVARAYQPLDAATSSPSRCSHARLPRCSHARLEEQFPRHAGAGVVGQLSLIETTEEEHKSDPGALRALRRF